MERERKGRDKQRENEREGGGEWLILILHHNNPALFP